MFKQHIITANNDVIRSSIYAYNSHALGDTHTTTLSRGVACDAIMLATHLALNVDNVTTCHANVARCEKVGIMPAAKEAYTHALTLIPKVLLHILLYTLSHGCDGTT